MSVKAALLALVVVAGAAFAQATYGGYFGVNIANIDASRAKALKLNEERGVEIRAVREGSPADAAGIQPGDVLLAYNGENVLSAQQLARLVLETPPGRKVKVQYWRDGKTAFTTVTVANSPHASVFLGFPDQNLPNMGMMDVPRPLIVWDNPTLGIDFERVDAQLAGYFGVKGGVLVRAVGANSPAERAGIKAGDVIFSAAQQPCLTEHDFSWLFRQHSSSVPVSVMRDHKRVDLTIVLPQ